MRGGCDPRSRAACDHSFAPCTCIGPGHQWPYVLIPFYWLAERLPATRDGARRLGLVTIGQMTNAMVHAVENPPRGRRNPGCTGYSGALSDQSACRILSGALPRSTWWPIIFDPTLKNEGVGPRASVRWPLPV